MSNRADECLSAYDYDLPDTAIAQTPAMPRDSSRLLVVGRQGHWHQIFRDLPGQLQPGDLLILNNTKVIPARLLGRKVKTHPSDEPPLAVEVFLLEPRGERCWLALVKPGRRLKPGTCIEFGEGEVPLLRAKVLATDAETRGRLLAFEFSPDLTFDDVLTTLGQVPLPPYIQSQAANPEQYQTVFATLPGAVAAPTAGLHFTPDLLHQLKDSGIDHAYLTLHVGIGTFRPVESEHIIDHTMHAEWVEVPAQTVDCIHETQARGGRIIAVGTTSVRSLEGVATQLGTLQPYCGKVNLFIYPGYRWKVVDGLITNFHLPRSSLLMLVSALVGRERLLRLYEAAIAQSYRFYSFGDAMLILPEAVVGDQEPCA
ncbi:MAG: tRNA preQ1(34) S-adenosylmethionine ribosyltransferase-isomerase QueA [Thermosynechococcaceae cyanobacterium]